jgi:hypothetical protein
MNTLGRMALVAICMTLMVGCNDLLFPFNFEKKSTQVHHDPKPAKPIEEDTYNPWKVQANFNVIPDDMTSLHRPALQDYYGVTWAVTFVEPTSFEGAESQCAQVGGRLPDYYELDDLAELMGRGRKHGFHPEWVQSVKIDNQDSSWEMKNRMFWSTTPVVELATRHFVMSGATGEVIPNSRDEAGLEKSASALCVVGKGKVYTQCFSENEEFKTLALRQIIRKENGGVTSRFRIESQDHKDIITWYWQSSVMEWSGASFSADFKETGGKVISVVVKNNKGTLKLNSSNEPLEITCKQTF